VLVLTIALPLSCKPCTALMRTIYLTLPLPSYAEAVASPQTVRIQGWGIEAHFISADGWCRGSDDATAESGHQHDRHPRALLRGPAALTLELCSSMWVNLELDYVALCCPGAHSQSKGADRVFVTSHSPMLHRACTRNQRSASACKLKATVQCC